MRKILMMIVTCIALTIPFYTSVTTVTSKKSVVNEDNFKISYSFGGGEGDYVDTITRTISINQDGKVTIALAENITGIGDYTYTINKDKAKELYDYFVNNNFDKCTVKDNKDVLDGLSYNLELVSNGKTYSCGGYAIDDNTFNKFYQKFYEIVDYKDKLEDFNYDVRYEYEEQ